MGGQEYKAYFKLEEGVEPIQDLDPALHYIRCALSYQNQLLADIKTLLQQLVPEETREDAENS